MEPINPKRTEAIAKAGIAALLEAHNQYVTWGDEGRRTVKEKPDTYSPNRHSSTVYKMSAQTVGDLMCEKAVLDTFKEHGLSFEARTEETQRVTYKDSLCKDRVYLWIDGIDGTGPYIANGPCGTIISAFYTESPLYKDVVFAGIMEHTSGKLYTITTGDKTVIRNSEGVIIGSPTPSVKSALDAGTRLIIGRSLPYVDQHFWKPFEGQNRVTHRSTAVHIVHLLEGQTDGLIECTRKGNLELMAQVGLLQGAGMRVLDERGEDIGDKKYYKFGLDRHIGTFAWANPELEKQGMEHLRKTGGIGSPSRKGAQKHHT